MEDLGKEASVGVLRGQTNQAFKGHMTMFALAPEPPLFTCVTVLQLVERGSAPTQLDLQP